MERGAAEGGGEEGGGEEPGEGMFAEFVRLTCLTPCWFQSSTGGDRDPRG